MALLLLVTRRLVAQRLLAAALLVAMAFTVGVLVAGPIYANGSGRAIVSGTVAQTLVADRNVRYQVQRGAGFEPETADHAVRQAAALLPLQTVVAQAVTQPVSFIHQTGRVGAPLAFREGGFEHLRLSGRAPSVPGEVAVSTGDAFSLHADVGTTLRLRTLGGKTATVTVTGLYQIPAFGDPFWFGIQTMFIPDPIQGQARPVLLTPEGFRDLTRTLDVTNGAYTWDAYLNLRAASIDELRTAAAAVPRVLDRIKTTNGMTYATATTGLDAVVITAEGRVGNAQAPIYLVVVQIAAVALAVLAGVASLVLSRQSFELAVLKSRGFSRRQLLLAQAAQSGLAAAGALPLGLVLGLVLARMARTAHGPLLAGTPFPIHMTGPAVALGLAGALAGAVAFVLTSLPHVLRTVIEERHHVSRESRPLLSRFPLEVVAGALGGLAFWEVKHRGLGASLEHGGIDPLTLLAPTLLLFAASFAALRALLWVFRRLDGLVGRVRNLAVYLAGRRLARAPSASFATALLLLLATGLLVVSSSYRATILASHADVAHQQVGADWSVQTGTVGQGVALLRRLPRGTTGMFTGRVDSIDSSGFSVESVDVAAAGTNLAQAQVLAVDPGSYAGGAWWRTDYSDRALGDLLRSLAAPSWGLPLPRGTTAMTMEVTASQAATGLGLGAVVEHSDGTVASLTFGTLTRGTATYRTALEGASRLLSIVILKGDQLVAPPNIGLSVTGVQAEASSGAVGVPLGGWAPLQWHGSDGEVSSSGDRLQAHLHPGGGNAVAGFVPSQPEIPAIGSSDMAALDGRVVATVICGIGLRLRLDEFVQRFPGVPAGTPTVLISAPALLERLGSVPQPCGGVNEVRATGAGSPVPALRGLGVTPTLVASAVAVQATMSQDPQSLAVGMHFAAAAGGMSLVVIGLAVSLYFGQRRRQFEFAALRALGTERGQLVGALVGEQAFLLSFALVGALGLGYALLRLIMPYAARELATAVPPGLLRVDWFAIEAFGVAVVAVVVLALVLGIRALFGTSVPAVLRGEAE
jgi:FtsX-like permease family protein